MKLLVTSLQGGKTGGIVDDVVGKLGWNPALNLEDGVV